MRATVVKQDHNGGFVLQYDGVVVERGDQSVCIEAYFSRDYAAPYVTFRKGDRMTEWFYSDRYYNIFRIEDVETKRLKGWYCNFTTPAQIVFDEVKDQVTIRANDLALDVFVDLHGNFTLLDEDEFAALTISDEMRQAALEAVEQLHELVDVHTAPFDEIVMNLERFWELIERTHAQSLGVPKQQHNLLIQALIKMSDRNINIFEDIHDTLMNRAYTTDVWNAAYVINSCGDDQFTDFRGWLIAQGKTVYENVLRDPDSLADIVTIKDEEDTIWEGLAYVAMKAREEKNHADDLIGGIGYPALTGILPLRNPSEDYRKFYPKLWAKFGWSWTYLDNPDGERSSVKVDIRPFALKAEGDLEPLLKTSIREGYNFVQKLWDEYQSDVNRFDTPGAALLAAYHGDWLVAVGGVHTDPYVNESGIGRIRHVYVLPHYRRGGVGRSLMNALIDHARSHFHTLTLRTPTAHADAFYRAIGFSIEPRFADATHWMTLNRNSESSLED